eukprot:CCRYP_017425-RA/>CCRYP_017425-RA protein AED:0.29 eAED:0.44 QI:1127/0/0.5/1/0/0/2/0/120
MPFTCTIFATVFKGGVFLRMIYPLLLGRHPKTPKAKAYSSPSTGLSNPPLSNRSCAPEKSYHPHSSTVPIASIKVSAPTQTGGYLYLATSIIKNYPWRHDTLPRENNARHPPDSRLSDRN